MSTIDKEIVERTVKEGGVLALVQVKTAQVMLAGTRSAHEEIAVDVLEVVSGKCGPVLQLRQYTNAPNPEMKAGLEYIVAATPNVRFGATMQLEGFVQTSKDSSKQAVETHRKLAESFSTGP